ncbi:cytochrome b-c1 complex subunit 7-like [Trichogramma pretiosum]|uniref:cytochrome b-c1 complex subunit 7-like n=1 Tax=Trichogramma pretiosum TaxID=7493 RepID=UPI0006C963C4|nr:cytochrome b-c1 complex subunit 7-like [Trichogramma pretiosum]
MFRLRQQFMAIRRYSDQANKIIGPTWKEFWYNKAGFNQLGLMRDDCLHETPAVKEALRRLDPDILDERNFRIVRAGYLTLQKDVLPKEQWTKLKDDHLYLTPIVEEVEREWAEKAEWEKN